MKESSCVVAVKVSNEDQSYTHKFLLYPSAENPIVLSHDDKTLQDLVAQAVLEMKGVATDIALTIKLSW